MAKRNPSYYDTWANLGAPKMDNFNKKLPNGTRIFGPKATEGRVGHKHGHSGSNFYRSPHSSIGSTAIGRPHGKSKHPTHRWYECERK